MNENSTNELLGRMEERRSQMSKGQKRLADYVSKNYDKAVLDVYKRQVEHFNRIFKKMYEMTPVQYRNQK